MKLGVISLAAAASLALAAPAFGQTKPVELRYTTGAPAKTVWANQVERYQKDIAEATNGGIKINAFLGAQLGNEQDTMQQVQRGRIDMGGFSVAAAGLIVPELNLMNIAFLFDNEAVQDCVLDNHLVNISTDLLARKGVTMLSWSHVGISQIIGTKAYPTPADVKGLKARSSPTKTGAAFWAAVGANPNPIGITEWASAHQSGLVQVSDSGPTFYVGAGLNKIVPVVTMTNHIDAPGIVVINKRVYDGLTTDQRNGLVAAGAKADGALLRKEVRAWEQRMLALHKQGGGTIVDITPAQRQLWIDAVKPKWESMVKDVGTPEADKMWKAINDGKKACGSKTAS
jgi:TRAP-type C4-dicarboxylate transport system substrate-binding protein